MRKANAILVMLTGLSTTQLAIAVPIEWSVGDGGNGHYYEEVLGTTTWQDANEAAESLELDGVKGHLVSITSAGERDFLVEQFPHEVFTVFWLGGFQDTDAPDYSEPDGGWKWVTDEPFGFTDWASGEPNNMGTGSEEFLAMYSTSWQWNDYYATATAAGFYVEYPLPEPSTFLCLSLGMIALLIGDIERRSVIRPG